MNLGEITARVADMLARSDLDTQITAEIGLAVTKYRRRMGHLTELRDGTITTVADQAWYTTVDLTAADGLQDVSSRTAAPVSDIVRFQYVSLGSGNAPFVEIGYPEIKRLQDGTSSGGEPFQYARHAGAIGFWAVPSAAYTVYFSAHVRPPIPSSAGDTSVFFDEAQELIEYAAASQTAEKFTQDSERADRFRHLERDAWSHIVSEGSAKMATGRLACRF